MAEAKWVKFEVNMFEDTKLKIIDSMDKRDLIIYIWTRLLVLAGKANRGGHLYVTYNIAYTIKTLAIEFNRSIDDVKFAIKVLKKLEMIEVTEDKTFKIKNWEKHQNVEGMERLRSENSRRVAKHRAKNKEIKVTNYKEDNDKVIPVEEDKENTYVFNEEVVYVNHNSIAETDNKEIKTKEYDGSSDNSNCNVTCNDNNSSCNITVMEQKKKENKKKMEKKIETESDFNREDEEENNLIEVSDSSHSAETNENIDNQAIANLLKHYENITGICGGLNLGSVKLAISMHGYESVKMAVNKAIEVNKPNMTYINGILKNWRKEGYPNKREEIKNGSRSAGKNNAADKNEFTGFKPKESRKLTEAERKGAEDKLI